MWVALCAGGLVCVIVDRATDAIDALLMEDRQIRAARWANNITASSASGESGYLHFTRLPPQSTSARKPYSGRSQVGAVLTVWSIY